jgi:hypothetical protein
MLMTSVQPYREEVDGQPLHPLAFGGLQRVAFVLRMNVPNHDHEPSSIGNEMHK